MKVFLFCLIALIVFSSRGEALFEGDLFEEGDSYQGAADTQRTVRTNSKQKEIAQTKNSRSSAYTGLKVINEEDDDSDSLSDNSTPWGSYSTPRRGTYSVSATENIELSYRPTPLSQLNLKQKKEEADEQLDRLDCYLSRKSFLKPEEKKRLREIYSYWKETYDECQEAPESQVLFSEVRELMEDAAGILKEVAFLLDIPTPFKEKKNAFEEDENCRWIPSFLPQSRDRRHLRVRQLSRGNNNSLERARASAPVAPLDLIKMRAREKISHVSPWVKLFFETKINIFKEREQLQEKENLRQATLQEMAQLKQSKRASEREFVRKNWWKWWRLFSSSPTVHDYHESIAAAEKQASALTQQIQRHHSNIDVHNQDLSHFSREIARGISFRDNEWESELPTREHQERYRDSFNDEIRNIRMGFLSRAGIIPDADSAEFWRDELMFEHLFHRGKEESVR